MKYLSALVFICNYVSVLCVSSCFWNSEPYRYYNTRTPYNVVRGDFRDSLLKIKGCEPISMWGLFRHGKRYPSKDFGSAMVNALVIKNYIADSYVKGNTTLCAQDVENLMNWNSYQILYHNSSHRLHLEGFQEISDIARRLRLAYSDFFQNMGQDEYVLRAAHRLRVEETASSFVDGLGGNFTVEPPRLGNDVMAPYQMCPKYLIGSKKNPKTFIEAHSYLESSEYLEMKTRVERRLGLNFTLTRKNITAIEDLCTYTSDVIKNIVSPWCALLTMEDLKIIEYYGDLRNYYRNAYGLSTAKIFGGTALRDLLLKFKEVINGKGKKFYGYFTHASMMEMVYVALGLFKNETPITHKYRDPERKFRSSKTSGYSVNLVTVLYRCYNETSVDYNVGFYLNENRITDLCTDGICTWQEFQDMLMPFSNNTLESLECY